VVPVGEYPDVRRFRVGHRGYRRCQEARSQRWAAAQSVSLCLDVFRAWVHGVAPIGSILALVDPIGQMDTIKKGNCPATAFIRPEQIE